MFPYHENQNEVTLYEDHTIPEAALEAMKKIDKGRTIISKDLHQAQETKNGQNQKFQNHAVQ